MTIKVAKKNTALSDVRKTKYHKRCAALNCPHRGVYHTSRHLSYVDCSAVGGNITVAQAANCPGPEQVGFLLYIQEMAKANDIVTPSGPP